MTQADVLHRNRGKPSGAGLIAAPAVLITDRTARAQMHEFCGNVPAVAAGAGQFLWSAG